MVCHTTMIYATISSMMQHRRSNSKIGTMSSNVKHVELGQYRRDCIVDDNDIVA